MVVESVEPGYLHTKFFHVKRAREDDENRQNTFFLLKKDEFFTRQKIVT